MYSIVSTALVGVMIYTAYASRIQFYPTVRRHTLSLCLSFLQSLGCLLPEEDAQASRIPRVRRAAA